MSVTSYPVHVEAHIDPTLSRWQWLFKWLLAIPHYIVLAFLWIAFFVLSVIAFFAIMFTGRYPRAIFDFNVGVLRWTWRVQYYAYGALGTDRYPPFSLEDRADYPAHLEIDYPEHLSRGLVLVKWWLLAIPHYLIVGLFLGGVSFALGDAVRAGGGYERGGLGLIGLLVLMAAVVLLFTGRYPRSIFDLVLGLNRWVLRVGAYAALMTDVYPPFRLDQGGDDPTTLRTATLTAPPYAGATTWPSDPELPGQEGPTSTSGQTPPPPPETPGTRWTAGRIVALVTGSIVVLVSIGIGLGGAALAVADHGLRDDDGYLMSGTTELTTQTYALTSTSVEVHADAPVVLLPERLLGDVKITATSGDGPIFVGIARTADVAAYLSGVEHATVTDLADGPAYKDSGSSAPATAPTASDIWSVQTTGTGTQEIVWPVENGDWTLVVMNADASRGITTEVAAGATLPALDWLVPTLLVAAAAGLALGVVLLVVAFHRPPQRATSA
jgi:hypothetical protein